MKRGAWRVARAGCGCPTSHARFMVCVLLRAAGSLLVTSGRVGKMLASEARSRSRRLLIANRNRHMQEKWCRRRELNPHPPHGGPDFEW